MEQRKNNFAGADDIYLTSGNKIAVRRVSTYHDKNGQFHMEDKTTYHPKTAANIAKAKKIVGPVIRRGRN